jgi:hypothetical protein
VRALTLAGVVFRDLTDAATIKLALAWRRDDPTALVGTVLEAGVRVLSAVIVWPPRASRG